MKVAGSASQIPSTATNPTSLERAPDTTNELARGFIQPTDDRARRAIKAINEARLDDAAKHISAMPETSKIDLAWKQFLSAHLEWSRHDLMAAEGYLSQTISLLDSDDLNRDQSPATATIRLIAAAHELLGSVFRRQDRPKDAYTHHLNAHQLREMHGSPEEQCESATSLGFDAQIIRDGSNTIQWHRQAIAHATRIEDTPTNLLAISWTNLLHALMENEQFSEAVAAARQASNIWTSIDPTSPQTILADAQLGASLLRFAESILDSNTVDAHKALHEAIQLLDASGVSLLAFGPEFANEARQCKERLDFANRLLASLGI